MATNDLTEFQRRMLVCVRDRGEVRFSDPALDRLVELGFVEWHGCEAYVAYRITDAGRARLQAAS